ncbi:hypothetical protein [Nonomuraea sp. NPDC049480]|uniref:hypothetical protein n=1 Tax=Nonomuraea sp. NPDC049480 TaxID=3364353 RepID=UPI0037BA4BBD
MVVYGILHLKGAPDAVVPLGRPVPGVALGVPLGIEAERPSAGAASFELVGSLILPHAGVSA